jgi:hypothetical protein
MSHDSRVPVQYYNLSVPSVRASCFVGLTRLFCVQACVPAPPGVIVLFLTRLPVCVPATLGVTMNCGGGVIVTIGAPGVFLPVR